MIFTAILLQRIVSGLIVSPGINTRQKILSIREATCSKEDAEKVVELARRAISKSRTAAQELGQMEKVLGIRGKGSPTPGTIAVSFDAAFKKKGQSFFTMGGEERKANRGTVIGKVSAKAQNSRLISCDIQKDGGWGKTVNIC